MCKKTKLELALWVTCLITGSSVLFAQWRVAADRAEQIDQLAAMEFVCSPVAKMNEGPVAFSPCNARAQSQVQAPVQPVAQPSIDTRLVARLLVDSVTQVESAGNPRMVGQHGERGLMQIKAGAWGDVTRRLFGNRISFDRAFDGKLNQQVGAAYLADLQRFLADHQRSWKADERSLLLACYNAGPERVKRAGFDLGRLPAHTQDYVKRASALHDAFLADHNLEPSRIRMALAAQYSLAGGS